MLERALKCLQKSQAEIDRCLQFLRIGKFGLLILCDNEARFRMFGSPEN
jgi:hypothetical protein